MADPLKSLIEDFIHDSVFKCDDQLHGAYIDDDPLKYTDILVQSITPSEKRITVRGRSFTVAVWEEKDEG